MLLLTSFIFPRFAETFWGKSEVNRNTLHYFMPYLSVGATPIPIPILGRVNLRIRKNSIFGPRALTKKNLLSLVVDQIQCDLL